MVYLGMQGKIANKNQVQALHVYVNKLDVQEAKSQLMALYAGNASINHRFPLHICMCLVPEIDSVLNTHGHQKSKSSRHAKQHGLQVT